MDSGCHCDDFLRRQGTLGLKLFKRLLYHSKGDANLKRFRVTDPLDLQLPESLEGEPVAELIGASADLDLGHGEAQDDLLVQPLDIEQVDAMQNTILAGARQGDSEGQCAPWSRKNLKWIAEGLLG